MSRRQEVWRGRKVHRQAMLEPAQRQQDLERVRQQFWLYTKADKAPCGAKAIIDMIGNFSRKMVQLWRSYREIEVRPLEMPPVGIGAQLRCNYLEENLELQGIDLAKASRTKIALLDEADLVGNVLRGIIQDLLSDLPWLSKEDPRWSSTPDLARAARDAYDALKRRLERAHQQLKGTRKTLHRQEECPSTKPAEIVFKAPSNSEQGKRARTSIPRHVEQASNNISAVPNTAQKGKEVKCSKSDKDVLTLHIHSERRYRRQSRP